jgi:hypothetical protein
MNKTASCMPQLYHIVWMIFDQKVVWRDQTVVSERFPRAFASLLPDCTGPRVERSAAPKMVQHVVVEIVSKFFNGDFFHALFTTSKLLK